MRSVSGAAEVGSAYERYGEACQHRRRRAELGRRLAELRRLEEAEASLRRAAADGTAEDSSARTAISAPGRCASIRATRRQWRLPAAPLS